MILLQSRIKIVMVLFRRYQRVWPEIERNSKGTLQVQAILSFASSGVHTVSRLGPTASLLGEVNDAARLYHGIFFASLRSHFFPEFRVAKIALDGPARFLNTTRPTVIPRASVHWPCARRKVALVTAFSTNVQCRK
jgi:hypothetical protein